MREDDEFNAKTLGDLHQPGVKDDEGKPDASLLLMFGKALLAVAEIGTFGAEKYTRGGWESVSDGEDRYTAALLRHVFAEHYESRDTRGEGSSGLLHSAHAAWNALARLELQLRREAREDVYAAWEPENTSITKAAVTRLDSRLGG